MLMYMFLNYGGYNQHIYQRRFKCCFPQRRCEHTLRIRCMCIAAHLIPSHSRCLFVVTDIYLCLLSRIVACFSVCYDQGRTWGDKRSVLSYSAIAKAAGYYPRVRIIGGDLQNHVSFLTLVVYRPTKTRYVAPMMVQCWSTVYDAGPTLTHHWGSLSYLLESGRPASRNWPIHFHLPHSTQTITMITRKPNHAHHSNQGVLITPPCNNQ